jgi:hypothetical protein
LKKLYEMMSQEPWCKMPHDWAKLTDWQIEHLYLNPAIERNERLKREQPKSGRHDRERPDEDYQPPAPVTDNAFAKNPDGSINLDCPKLKNHVISQFIASGMSPKRAHETYHAQRHDPIMP